MKLALIVSLLTLLLTSCADIPSFKYCSTVEYKRVGTKIHILAECDAPIGNVVDIPTPLGMIPK